MKSTIRATGSDAAQWGERGVTAAAEGAVRGDAGRDLSEASCSVPHVGTAT